MALAFRFFLKGERNQDTVFLLNILLGLLHYFKLKTKNLSAMFVCMHLCMLLVSFFLSPKSAIPFTLSPFGPFYWVLAASKWGFPPGTPVFPFILYGCLESDVPLSLSKVGLGHVGLL